MFKSYKELCDVVSLVVYCPSERAFLLTKEPSGEFWMPSSKAEKNCWKMTAHKINFELFGMDAVSQCQPLRVYKIWLPKHALSSVYHAVYKVAIKPDVKKRARLRAGLRNRLQWFTLVELERHRAHATLRSPELAVFAQMAVGDQPKDVDSSDFETGVLVEICEANILIGVDVAGGAVALASPHYQLLQAANYNKDDQIRLYREFIFSVYPALYMSPNAFVQFMTDLGWERGQCSSLFRAADVSSRGGLSFHELMLWSAASEPSTPHSGIPAEIRCRYIFRYFDSNRDLKLEYVEFRELVAATRLARCLPVDALSVARDADIYVRQLGLQPNAQVPLAEFIRGAGAGELRLRGTSALLRAPTGLAAYLFDLQERDGIISKPTTSKISTHGVTELDVLKKHTGGAGCAGGAGRAEGRASLAHSDYELANCVVRLRGRAPPEFIPLTDFAEALSASTVRMLATAVNSIDLLGSNSTPAEALAAINYFATPIEKPIHKRVSGGGSVSVSKPAWAWAEPAEEAALGNLLLKLADAVKPIFQSEPRLLRLNSPVYVIGDLHGNLAALLGLERLLWGAGGAAAARLLLLGDYVDRGAHGSELLARLLAAKLQRPRAVHLVRGNHETRDIQQLFSFHTECISKYGEVEGGRIWNAINQVFDVLPLAAVVDDKVFCCHGGIPPPWVCPLMTAIDKVPVPLPKPAEQSSIAWELLWNDPVKPNRITASLALELAANEGFAANAKRGTGHVFDQSALDRFLLANRLSHVLRAHELQQNGFMCQLSGRLISVFSSWNYCGGNNDSGIALLDDGKLRLIRVSED